MQPTVLVATTTWFAMPARVAMAFSKAGARVSGIVPRGSPLEKVACVENKLRYSPTKPLRALAEAIETLRPDLIIPCDDRVVEHLHRLHSQCAGPVGNQNTCRIIERSLGDPAGYKVTSSRGKLLQLAERCGLRTPKTSVIHQVQDLRAWVQTNGLPAVLKVDGSWGGSGVRVVHSWEEAELAYLRLTRPITGTIILKCLSFHDFYPLFSRRDGGSLEITVQKYIDGYSSNSLLACWEGNVLDELSVEALYVVDKLGSSTIVRTIENPEMTSAGQSLVRELGISGFCGLDFIIENKTGNAYLIEMNPRATQIGHLMPNGRKSLIGTLESRISGEVSPVAPPFEHGTIAFFPHILRCSPDNPVLALPELHYDVPWEEPNLTQELMRKPWNSRHLSALLYRAVEKFLDQTGAKPTKRLTPEDLGPQPAK